MISRSELVVEWRIAGNELIRVEKLKNGYDTICEDEKVFLTKEAFLKCFNAWIVEEQKHKEELERRKKELEDQEHEWKENLKREYEAILERKKKDAEVAAENKDVETC